MKHVSPHTQRFFRVLATLAVCICSGCASGSASGAVNPTVNAVFTQAAQTAYPQLTANAATQQYYAAVSAPTADKIYQSQTETAVAVGDLNIPLTTPEPASATGTPTAGPTSGNTQPTYTPATLASATPQPASNPTLAPGSEAACIPNNPAQTGKVLDILDGQTIKVMIDGKTYIVRYIGISAPDIKNKEFYSAESRLKNSELVYAKDITLYKDSLDADPFGRLLRYVKIGDTFVNYTLVAQGFAKAAPAAPDNACDAAFQGAQDQASAAKSGLWGTR